jgi:hypothetical protein
MLMGLLPNHWHSEVSVSQLQLLLQRAVVTPHPLDFMSVGKLMSLPATKQLSTSDVVDLLKRLTAQATCVSSEA